MISFSFVGGKYMKVKDLINELKRYNPELDIIFTDESYDSGDNFFDNVCSNDCMIYEANYDRESEKSFPASEIDVTPNAIAISINGLDLIDTLV